MSDKPQPAPAIEPDPFAGHGGAYRIDANGKRVRDLGDTASAVTAEPSTPKSKVSKG